ncbi:hypothetical protein KCP75_05960 [Salmonella enterica subsp. enterica]|nr:hypothetical protein KCP75_05960 [Salmonella enterica subsp. enterica]
MTSRSLVVSYCGFVPPPPGNATLSPSMFHLVRQFFRHYCVPSRADQLVIDNGRYTKAANRSISANCSGVAINPAKASGAI